MIDPITSGLRDSIKMLRNGGLKSFQRPLSADEIKKIRQNTGLSAQNFADSLGISLDTLKSWESGRRSPNKLSTRLLYESSNA